MSMTPGVPAYLTVSLMAVMRSLRAHLASELGQQVIFPSDKVSCTQMQIDEMCLEATITKHSYTRTPDPKPLKIKSLVKTGSLLQARRR